MASSSSAAAAPEGADKPQPPRRKKYVRAVGPRLRVLMFIILGLVALLSANGLYLSGVTLLEWVKGNSYQNYFYQYMFLAHLVMGLLLILPFVVFGVAHIYNAYNRPNKRAVRVGYALFSVGLIVLASGVALMRLEPFSVGSVNVSIPPIKSPTTRSAVYWAHIIAPLLAVWLYVLH